MVKNFLKKIYKYFYNVEWRYFSFVTHKFLLLIGVRVGFGFRSYHFPIVRRAKSATIEIGNGVTFINHNNANPVGISHACIVVAAPGAHVTIGNYCGFSGAVINALGEICIGDHVLLGANVQIFDNDFHSLNWEDRHDISAKPGNSRPVRIENDVFIGTGAIILKGVEIGRGAVIGAGSVVTKSVEPFSIYAGNPARKVGNAPQ